MQGLERVGLTTCQDPIFGNPTIVTSHSFCIPQYQNQLQGQAEEDTMTANNSGLCDEMT